MRWWGSPRWAASTSPTPDVGRVFSMLPPLSRAGAAAGRSSALSFSFMGRHLSAAPLLHAIQAQALVPVAVGAEAALPCYDKQAWEAELVAVELAVHISITFLATERENWSYLQCIDTKTNQLIPANLAT